MWEQGRRKGQWETKEKVTKWNLEKIMSILLEAEVYNVTYGITVSFNEKGKTKESSPAFPSPPKTIENLFNCLVIRELIVIWH